MTAVGKNKWAALVVLSVSYLMVVLDVSIVNVALDDIRTDLEFNQADLQWILSGYALTFGGFLLLGGRMGDLLGRRKIFMAGLILFAAFSLMCGLSTSPGMLITARILQGAAAALLSPSVFSIVSVTFKEGSDRNKALGILGAVAGSGAAIGLIVGGVLTETAGWRWCFYVNIPIALITLILAVRYVEESSADSESRHFDAAGAVLITSALLILVYALTQAEKAGWASLQTIGLIALSIVLHILFVIVERRSQHPLVPLTFFGQHRVATGSNIIGFGLGMIVSGIFLLLSLYMQQVLGYEPLKTGVAYLAVALTAIFAAGAAQALVTKIGVRTVIIIGMALLGVGLALLTQIATDSSYWSALFPGYFLIGVGLGFAFVPVSIAALIGVGPTNAGLASGLINTSQQIGGAFGIAILATVASNVTGPPEKIVPQELTQKLTDGYSTAMAVAVGFAVLSLLAAIALLRGPGLAEAGKEGSIPAHMG